MVPNVPSLFLGFLALLCCSLSVLRRKSLLETFDLLLQSINLLLHERIVLEGGAENVNFDARRPLFYEDLLLIEPSYLDPFLIGVAEVGPGEPLSEIGPT